MRRVVLIAVALLGSCAPRVRDAPAPIAEGEPAVCRIGPDGGPPPSMPRQADRGIGGTGTPPIAVRQADRGIGGTGAPPEAVRQADRGIGGTGIIGVVTGFASVCLAGREVAFDDAVPVRVDGERASPADLRAGQLAAVEAGGSDAMLRARGIAVRHEVIGPVEAVDGDGVLRVAGQRVTVSEQARLATPGSAAMPRRGEWVAVSGLRGSDDAIQATRLDRVPSGTALVHGTLQDEGGTLRIGALEVRPVSGLRAAPGRSVAASGRYEGGVLYADILADDVLAESPAAYFGGNVRTFVLEGYITAGDGRIRFGQGLDIAAPAGTSAFALRRGVVEFERGQDGSLRATALHDFGAASHGSGVPARGLGPALPPRLGAGRGEPSAGSRTGEPAQVPSRDFERAPVPDRAFGDRSGDRSGSGPGGGLPGFAPGRPGFGPGLGSFGGGPDGGPGGLGAGRGGSGSGGGPGR